MYDRRFTGETRRDNDKSCEDSRTEEQLGTGEENNNDNGNEMNDFKMSENAGDSVAEGNNKSEKSHAASYVHMNTTENNTSAQKEISHNELMCEIGESNSSKFAKYEDNNEEDEEPLERACSEGAGDDGARNNKNAKVAADDESDRNTGKARKRQGGQVLRRAPKSHVSTKSEISLTPYTTGLPGECIAENGIGEFKYNIYVKKCEPHVRDALAFLNMTFEWDRRNTALYPDTADGEMLKEASKKLRKYIQAHVLQFKPYFMRLNGKYIFTTCILGDMLSREDITFSDVIKYVETFTNKELFYFLLKNAYQYDIPDSMLGFAVEKESIFRDFVEGAAYPKDIKPILLDIYVKYKLENIECAEFKYWFVNFLKCYFEKYIEIMESLRDVRDRIYKGMIAEIRKFSKLPGVMDNTLFRKMILWGGKHKDIILENMIFAVGSAGYYGSANGGFISIGYGYDGFSGKKYDFDIIDDKLDSFAIPETEILMNILLNHDCSVNEISDKTGINKNKIYKLIKELTLQNIIVKKPGCKYSLNKPHLKDIILLLEKYGRDDES